MPHATQTSNPGPRLGFGPQQHTAEEARERAAEIEHVLALRRREGEARQRQEKEDAAAIERVREARQVVEQSIQGLQRTASELRDLARRSPNEASPNHLTYANAHLRLTGALANGIHRAASMERVLNSADAQREEARRREEEDRLHRELRAHELRARNLALPAADVDDFDEVFGDLIDA